MSRIEELKCWPEYFAAIEADAKPFELRRDDRQYEPGVTLHLREWNPATESYTGRDMLREVTYVLRDVPEWGLAPGYAILGLSRPGE
jgi:hypothetical protein